jgi:hypothetical protein
MKTSSFWKEDSWGREFVYWDHMSGTSRTEPSVRGPVLTRRRLVWGRRRVEVGGPNISVTVDKYLSVRHLMEADSGRLNRIDHRIRDSYCPHCDVSEHKFGKMFMMGSVSSCNRDWLASKRYREERCLLDMMTPCGSCKNRRFGGIYCLHLQGKRLLIPRFIVRISHGGRETDSRRSSLLPKRKRQL